MTCFIGRNISIECKFIPWNRIKPAFFFFLNKALKGLFYWHIQEYLRFIISRVSLITFHCTQCIGEHHLCKSFQTITESRLLANYSDFIYINCTDYISSLYFGILRQ